MSSFILEPLKGLLDPTDGTLLDTIVLVDMDDINIPIGCFSTNPCYNNPTTVTGLLNAIIEKLCACC